MILSSLFFTPRKKDTTRRQNYTGTLVFFGYRRDASLMGLDVGVGRLGQEIVCREIDVEAYNTQFYNYN